MLTRRPRADMSKYEILGILLERGLSLRDIASTCRLSLGWTSAMLAKQGYEWIPGRWRRKRGSAAQSPR